MSDSPRLIDCLAVPFRLNTPRQHFITKSWVRLLYLFFIFSSVQSFSHVWLCDPMDCSTPGFPVHHQLPEFTQTHAHWVSDAIQPSHPLLSPCPPSFNLSQHQGLFKWVRSLHLVAKVSDFFSMNKFLKEQGDYVLTWNSLQGVHKKWSAFPTVTSKPAFVNKGIYVNKYVTIFASLCMRKGRRQWHPTPVLLPGKSPWTEEPSGPQSVELQRVEHNWRDLAHTLVSLRFINLSYHLPGWAWLTVLQG